MKGDKDLTQSNTEFKKIAKRIVVLSQKRPSHKELLDFLKGVISEKLKIKSKVSLDPLQIDKTLSEKNCREGLPLINKKEVPLDIKAAKNLFSNLMKRLKENEKISKDIEALKQAEDTNKLDLEEVFKRTASDDYSYLLSVSNELGLNGHLLIFLAENSLQPIFETYAEQLKPLIDQEKWWKGYCPICGSKPLIAELIGTEKQRFLVCSCCSFEWRFLRAKCPFCDSEGEGSFKYFFTENEGRVYRVETCQKCKKYMKTIDADELGVKVYPSVEDLGTLYLDVLAKKEGYTREVNPLGLDFGDLQK